MTEVANKDKDAEERSVCAFRGCVTNEFDIRNKVDNALEMQMSTASLSTVKIFQ